MSISVRDFLTTASRVIEAGVLPGVTDKYARTQLLAVMQGLELGLELHDKQGQALYRQNRDLRALCDTVEQTVAAVPVAPFDAELRGLLATVRPDAASAAPGDYVPVGELAEINAELRACLASVIRILCRAELRELPAYRAIRVRAREIFSDSYGLNLAYRPVWVA